MRKGGLGRARSISVVEICIKWIDGFGRTKGVGEGEGDWDFVSNAWVGHGGLLRQCVRE